MTVVYKRLHDNTAWARPVERWHGSFTRIPCHKLYELSTRTYVDVQHVVLNKDSTVQGYIVGGRFVNSERVPSEFELVVVED